VAVWGAVLSVQDVPNGNDVIGIDPDHHGVHNRALSSDLSLAARAGYFRSVAGSARGCGRLGGGLCDGHPVPDKHAHLLLLAASSDRHAAGRLSYLHHSQPVDAQHEIRISGTISLSLNFARNNTGIRYIPDVIRSYSRRARSAINPLEAYKNRTWHSRGKIFYLSKFSYHFSAKTDHD